MPYQEASSWSITRVNTSASAHDRIFKGLSHPYRPEQDQHSQHAGPEASVRKEHLDHYVSEQLAGFELYVIKWVQILRQHVILS